MQMIRDDGGRKEAGFDGVLEYDSVNEVAESNEWEFTEDGDIA